MNHLIMILNNIDLAATFNNKNNNKVSLFLTIYKNRVMEQNMCSGVSSFNEQNSFKYSVGAEDKLSFVISIFPFYLCN